MEILQLRYFQMMARLESVTEAANYFRVPQSAMSQTLKRLEHDLGDIKLFDRRSNHIYLNENGKYFLKSVDQALGILDDAVASLKDTEDRLSGPINLLVMENRRYITYCVSQFAQMYPDVNFTMCYDFYGADMDCDMCVTAAPFYQQMRASVPLIREEIILAVHESHPRAGQESVSLIELKDDKFITMSRNSSLYKITYRACREAGFEPHVPYVCDDPYFVRKYISLNMGVALAPSVSWAGRFRENTRLIHVNEPDMVSTSYLCWDENRYQTAVVRKFREFLQAEALKIENNLIAAD